MMSKFSSLRSARAPLSRLLSQPATSVALRQKPAASRWTEAWTEAPSNGMRRQRVDGYSSSSTSSSSRRTGGTSSSSRSSFSSSPSVHRQSERWKPEPASSSSSGQPSSNWNQQYQAAQPEFQINQHNQRQTHVQYTQRLMHPNQNAWYQRVGQRPNSASSSSSSSTSAGQRLLISYHDLEKALEKRGLRSVRVVLSAICGLAAMGVLAWPKIKQWGAVEGAEVAAASLEDEQLQSKFNEMVKNVLNDEETLKHAETLLKNAVSNLLQDEEFTATTIDWTADVLYAAILRDELIERGTEYVAEVFERDESVASAEQFLSDAVTRIANDESVQDSVASGFWSSIRASVVGRRQNKTPSEAIPEEQSTSEKQQVSATTNASSSKGALSAGIASASAVVERSETTEVASSKDKADGRSAAPSS